MVNNRVVYLNLGLHSECTQGFGLTHNEPDRFCSLCHTLSLLEDINQVDTILITHGGDFNKHTSLPLRGFDKLFLIQSLNRGG